MQVYDERKHMAGFREAVKQHRTEQVELGYEFPLAALSLGAKEPFTIRARRLNMTDKLILDLPEHLQAIVYEGYRVVREATKRVQRDNEDPQTLAEMVANNTRALPAADALMVVSCIHPPVVATEAEEARAADEDTIWVGRIPAEDRIDFLIATANASSEQAKRLTLFRPESAIDVPYRAVEPMAPEPVGSPAVGGTGL